MKKFISTLLIVIGILFLMIPSINKMIIKKNTESKIDIIDSVSYEEIIENMELEVEYDYSSIEDVGVTSTIFGTLNFDNKSIIGQLVIPDLDLILPILKGINNANLAVGAATMVPEQKMGEGNYPLAGHKMKQKDILFGSLMDIEIDSLVYMTDKNMVYGYKIYDIKVVEDTAFYMLEDKEAEKRGKPIVSLMTCYYSSKTGKRFFALGELIDKYPYEEGFVKK